MAAPPPAPSPRLPATSQSFQIWEAFLAKDSCVLNNEYESEEKLSHSYAEILYEIKYTLATTEVIIHWIFYVPSISQYQHGIQRFSIPLRGLPSLKGIQRRCWSSKCDA